MANVKDVKKFILENQFERINYNDTRWLWK